MLNDNLCLLKIKIFLLSVLLSLNVIESKISITIDSNALEKVIYSGVEIKIASDSDIALFFEDIKLKAAVKKHYDRLPTDVFFKSPTPWGDLYKKYNWEEVKTITTVKSAKIKEFKKEPVVYTNDFENNSEKPVKVNAGLSKTIENTLRTTWTRSKALSMTQNFDYGINLLSASTGLSITSFWGRDEEESTTKTVGTTSNIEIELKPGQSATSKLIINSGFIEIEVVYKTILRGNLAVNFQRPFRGHSFWAPQVQDVLKSAGIENEQNFTQNVRVGFNVDAKLVVTDRDSGKPL